MVMLLHSLTIAVYSFGLILNLPKDLSTYSGDKIQRLKEIGISFTEKDADVNFLVTFSPKVAGIIFAILLVVNQSEKDRKCVISPKKKKELLTYCVWLICLASCVVLSLVQMLLFGKSRKFSNFSHLPHLDGLQILWLRLETHHYKLRVFHYQVLQCLLLHFFACSTLHGTLNTPLT